MRHKLPQARLGRHEVWLRAVGVGAHLLDRAWCEKHLQPHALYRLVQSLLEGLDDARALRCAVAKRVPQQRSIRAARLRSNGLRRQRQCCLLRLGGLSGALFQRRRRRGRIEVTELLQRLELLAQRALALHQYALQLLNVRLPPPRSPRRAAAAIGVPTGAL